MIELIHGLGARPQETLGPVFRDHTRGQLRIDTVLSEGELAGPKTLGSERSMPLMPHLDERIDEWRAFLRDHDVPATLNDFIVPGADATGHMSESQQHQWGQRQFNRICKLTVEGHGRLGLEPHEELAYLRFATPYSLRRGMISLRLACEGWLWDGPGAPRNDLATVAREHGTSIKVLSDSYARYLDLRGTIEGTPEAVIREALGHPRRPALRLAS